MKGRLLWSGRDLDRAFFNACVEFSGERIHVFYESYDGSPKRIVITSRKPCICIEHELGDELISALLESA